MFKSGSGGSAAPLGVADGHALSAPLSQTGSGDRGEWGGAAREIAAKRTHGSTVTRIGGVSTYTFNVGRQNNRRDSIRVGGLCELNHLVDFEGGVRAEGGLSA